MNSDSLPRVELHDPLGLHRQVTLYKTRSPGLSIKSGEYYQLILRKPADGDFVLTEHHGNWDSETGDRAPGHTSTVVDHYLSLEEGNAAFEKRKEFRAAQGYIHGQKPDYDPKKAIEEFVEVDESALKTEKP
jgi:hypothetical protein